MASMPLPEPLIPNAANAMSAYSNGYTLGKDQMNTQTMQTAGNAMASGDMRGGANAMMRGGLVQEGQGMLEKITQAARQAKSDALQEAMRKNDIIAGVAQRTPDEQWTPTVARMQQMGLIDAATAEKYSDPSTRNIAIGQSSQAGEIMKNESERRKLDILSQKNDITEAKNATAADTKNSGLLSDDAIELTANKYIKTGVMDALGQGTIGSTNRTKVLDRAAALIKEKGQTAQDIVDNKTELAAETAGARNSGVQQSRMENAAQELKNFIPMARETLAKLPRTSFLPWNKLVEGYQNQTLSPEQADAHAAVQAVRNAYAAVIQRGSGATTVNSQLEADKLLNTAQSHEASDAVLNRMELEANVGKKAPAQIREEHRQEKAGRSGGGGAPSGVPAAAAQYLKSNATPEIIQQFNAKYGQGAAEGILGTR